VDVDAMRAGRAQPVVNGGAAMELVSCGRPFPGHEIAIVGAGGRHLGEREVGEIRLRGPSVTAGYFGDAEATGEAFEGGWLRTGDLGYRAGGELFICGRAKDLIILNGKNFYPQDIERVVSRIDGIRDGQCVAFSRFDPTGAEVAVVVAESRKNVEGLAAAILAEVRAELGLTVTEIHFIKRGTLPKTSSGKVRRRECRRRLEALELELVSEGDADSVDRALDDVSPSVPPPSPPPPRPPSYARPAPLQGAAADGIQ
jgi:fatty-acyl-CoA synthase